MLLAIDACSSSTNCDARLASASNCMPFTRTPQSALVQHNRASAHPPTAYRRRHPTHLLPPDFIAQRPASLSPHRNACVQSQQGIIKRNTVREECQE
jgi:hypothetical protein